MHAHRRPRRVLGDPSRVLLARARLAALSLPSAARYATSASTETSTTPANGETSPAIAALGARTNAAVAIEVAVARASVAIVVVVVVVVVSMARARAIERARASTRRLETHRPRPRTARAGTTVDDDIVGDVVVGIGGGGGGGDARRRASRGDVDRTTERPNDRPTDGFLEWCAPPIFQNVRVVSVYKDSNVTIVVFETNSCGVPPRTSRDRSEEKEPTLSTRTDPSRKAGRGRRRDGDERRARLGEARHIDASE